MNARFDDLVITRWGARFQGQRFSCSIGRGGIGIKMGEGDGITPVGIFQLARIHYRPDRLKCVGGHAIGLNDLWSDDPKDPNYNQLVHSVAHPFSHEPLRRADPLYNALGVLTYNWPDATPGKGSAIFLHIWRKPRHRTEGCVAFGERNLLKILSRWTQKSRVVVLP